MENSFEKLYPHIVKWVKAQGWIEIGQDGFSRSLVRCVDEGGLIWESNDQHQTIEEALQALEEALEQILKEYNI